jgi:hypothetical protein
LLFLCSARGYGCGSGSQAAVHHQVMEEAQIRTTTAMVAYFAALYINQAKLPEEHITAY